MSSAAPVRCVVVAKLIQKKTLLDYVGDDGEVGMFMAAVDEESTAPPLRVLLPLAVIEDFGHPEQLTLLIRPGDELNDADVAFQASSGE